MARTAVTLTAGARSTFQYLGTLAAPLLGTVMDQANGHKISPKRGHKLALLIYNSKAGNIVCTIRKGVYPPAESSGQGDLVSANIPTVSFAMITGLESARFSQANGDVNVDFDAGATGELWALEMPA